MNIDWKSPKVVLLAVLSLMALLGLAKLVWMALQAGLNMASPGLGDKARGIAGI